MAKVEEKKATPKAPAKPAPPTEKEREESLKNEPFVVQSYHVKDGKFVITDKFGRVIELPAMPGLK
jgi:hypothetical protein